MVPGQYLEALDVLEARAEEQQRKARRERIATAVLTGFAHHGGEDSAIRDAVRWADRLIAELDKEPE